MQRTVVAIAVVLVILIAASPASAQQYFQKWDVYAGYSYLNTPTKDLTQHGFNVSFGRNLNKWVALGADFSKFEGSGAQVSSGTEMAARLPKPILAGLPAGVPQLLPGVKLRVPLNASTATFAMGTQFQVRKFKLITPFFRPFLGAFHSRGEGKPTKITAVTLPPGVTPQTLNAILATIPSSTMLAAVTQSETCLGYGVGGGFDLNISKPIGIRFATDYIRTTLFDEKQNNVRIAFGLIYRFGGEVKPTKSR